MHVIVYIYIYTLRLCYFNLTILASDGSLANISLQCFIQKFFQEGALFFLSCHVVVLYARDCLYIYIYLKASVIRATLIQ